MTFPIMPQTLQRFLIVGMGGFLGANARYLIGVWVQQRVGSDFPWGTFLINITGSLLLGFLFSLFARIAPADNLRLFLPIGFVGAYTTFSTFENDTFNLLNSREWARLLFYTSGSVLLGFFSFYIGYICGGLLRRPI